jgi:hypothetical protein
MLWLAKTEIPQIFSVKRALWLQPNSLCRPVCFFAYRRLYSYQGIPLPVVRHLARQTLAALHFLHTKCQITHLGEPLAPAWQLPASQWRLLGSSPPAVCMGV